MKNRILLILSLLIKQLASVTVNSACMMTYGQSKEPASLQRLKKQRKYQWLLYWRFVLMQKFIFF